MKVWEIKPQENDACIASCELGDYCIKNGISQKNCSTLFLKYVGMIIEENDVFVPLSESIVLRNKIIKKARKKRF